MNYTGVKHSFSRFLSTRYGIGPSAGDEWQRQRPGDSRDVSHIMDMTFVDLKPSPSAAQPQLKVYNLAQTHTHTHTFNHHLKYLKVFVTLFLELLHQTRVFHSAAV